MVTNRQIRRLLKLVNGAKSVAESAPQAGMDEKTARKYLQAGKLPSELAVEHVWRTRTDPFQEVWGELQQMHYLDRYGKEAADSYAGSWYTRWDRVGPASKPIGLPASDYTEKEYGSIVYCRGPLFLDALATAMGGDSFDRFLRSYVQRFWCGIARGDDFRSTAEEECGCDLGALFNAWLGSP